MALEQTLVESETWCAAVYGVTKSWTQFSSWTTRNLIMYTFVQYFKQTANILLISYLVRNIGNPKVKQDKGSNLSRIRKNCLLGWVLIKYWDIGTWNINMNMVFSLPSHGEGNGTPLQYSCLKNPMDGGAWWAAVHGVAKSQTRLSNFTFTFHFHALEKEMATHSSILAWRIPGMGEPDGLPSMGSHRVGHNWSDLAAAAAALPSKGSHYIYEYRYRDK